MQKKSWMFDNADIEYLFVVFLLFFIVSIAYADAVENNGTVRSTQNSSADVGNMSSIPEKFANETLERGAGITPDSVFYFIEDGILSKFRDDSSNREKKIAEFRAMIKKGDIEDAKKALNRYKQYADNLEKEVSPDKKEEAQKSAAAIRNTINELETEIPAGERKEIVDNVVNQENRISKAAEIAGKIKELCETLSKIDPEQYSKICKTDDDKNAPKWQRELDNKLTNEQKQEAEDFFNIMSQCYENPKKCQCDKIKIEKFSVICKEKAPLAAKCKEGDAKSCEQMNSGDDPRDALPDYLQSVLDKVEKRFSKAEFDNFMPPECQKAGAKSPQECMKIMFKAHAPEECRQAVDDGRIKLDNSKEAENLCQEIMFKANAPSECIEANIKDPKSCGKLMFQNKAPEECKQAGLTGGSESDSRKCEEIMKNKHNNGPQMNGPQGGFGRDCRQLQDKEERLKCFDETFSNVQQQYGEHNGFEQQGQQGQYNGQGQYGQRGSNGGEGNWPEPCRRANALEPEACRKVMDAEGQRMREQGQQRMQENQQQFGQQQMSCQPGQPCQQNQQPNNFCPPGQVCPPQNQENSQSANTQNQQTATGTGTTNEVSTSGGATSSSSTASGTGGTASSSTTGTSTESTTTSTSSSTTSSSTTSSSTSSTGSSTTATSTGSGVTGSVIGDNGFLKYYFRG